MRQRITRDGDRGALTLEQKLQRLSEKYRHEFADDESRRETLHELRRLEKKLAEKVGR